MTITILRTQYANDIETTCEGQGLSNKEYDYSGLGETWSTPRIFRIPSGSGDSNILNDRYVAVMGGGMGSGTKCVDCCSVIGIPIIPFSISSITCTSVCYGINYCPNISAS